MLSGPKSPTRRTEVSSSWKESGAKQVIEERSDHGGYTLKELHRVAENPELWGRLHGKVLDLVTREPVHFIPRPLQGRLFRFYRHCRDAAKPMRAIMCKVRRGGGSTAAEAIMYCHAHNYNARLGAIGTDHEVSMNMFKFLTTFDKEDDFPGWGRHTKRLETGRMEWGNGSSWERYTAENPEAARSAGLQGYHATEVGRWQEGGAQDAHETLKSMLGAVPKRGFTVVIEESTANGAAGAFYHRFEKGRWPTAAELGVDEGQEWWRKWEDETPQNLIEIGSELQFVRIFAAWFEDDENAQPVSEADRSYLERTLDDKEKALIARYGDGQRIGDQVKRSNQWEQLAWRRSVIESEFEGDVEAFEQEYPSSPREAFASSGRHTFNRNGCAWMQALAKSSHAEAGILAEQHGGVVFTRTDSGEAWLQVWEQPREGHRYVIGVDTMSGEEQVQGSRVHDWNAAIVLRAAYIDDDGRKRAPKTAAALNSRNINDPDVLVSLTHLMSRFYGGCLIVPEANNTGSAYISHAKLRGMNLYRREKLDRFTSETTDIVGWWTDDKTRPQLIGAMQAAIRNNAQEATRGDGLECTSLTLANECATMVKNTKGKDVAAPGSNDDHVFACAMGYLNLSGATYYAGFRRRKRGPVDKKDWKKLG